MKTMRAILPASLALLLAAGALTLAIPAAAADPPDDTENSTAPRPWRDKLDRAASDLLNGEASRSAAGDRLDLIIATEPADISAARSAVARSGGIVHTSDAELGYLRVRIPRSAVADVVGESTVVAADLDRIVPLPNPAPLGVAPASDVTTASMPGSDTPATNPYMPTDEIGAVTFAQEHRADPNRRVRVGVVDTGVDLGHPALQRDGAPVTKLWTTTTIPGTDPDALWVALETEVTAAADGGFSVAGEQYIAPGAGTYLLGFLKESGHEPYRNDLNGNGSPDELLPILVMDEQVWVNLRADGDFTADQMVLANGPAGALRPDDPDTVPDETLAFVAQTGTGTMWDGTKVPYVHIGIDQIGHGTHVAGILAGNSLYGSQASGVAPEVDLYSVQVCSSVGCSTGAMSDAVVLLAGTHEVDVINMSIGGINALNDGRSASEILYQRVAEDYNVTLVMAAGNDGDGTNTTGSPSAAERVLAVGASVSPEMWRALYEVEGPAGIFNFSSRGLREDGALKPEIVAPGAAMSTMPVAVSSPDEAGYGLMNGTSMASPMAAGAVALLIQAARADGIDVDDIDLVNALVTGATHIEGQDVTGEGAGRIDLALAWRALRIGTVVTAIAVDAPVCTPFSSELSTPGRGVGIHQRCGISRGGSVPGSNDFPVTLTRTSGRPGDVSVNLKWRTASDNLGLLPSKIALPLNVPVTVVVAAELVAGTHTAGLLEIDDPATSLTDQFLPVSVIVGEQLDPTSLTWQHQGTVSPGISNHYYVEIPDFVTFQSINISNASDDAMLRFVTFWPAGYPASPDETDGCYTNDPQGRVCEAKERTFEESFPGVWEISVQTPIRGIPDTPFALNFTGAAAVGLERQIVIPQVEIGAVGEFSSTFASSARVQEPMAFAPALSENRYDRFYLADGESRTVELEVPDGISFVSGRAWSVDGADLEIVTEIDGEPLGHSDGVLPGEFTAFAEAGMHIMVTVTARELPEGVRTEVRYEDRFHRGWGEQRGQIQLTGAETVPVTVRDGALPTWAHAVTTVTGTITVEAEPLPGRVLGTNLRLRYNETLVLAQTPLRVAPETASLNITSGLVDATGAEYVVFEGDEPTGFEVVRATLDQDGELTLGPDLSDWPFFDIDATYTVVQVRDPVGFAPKARSVEAEYIDGAFVARFAQIATAEPGPEVDTSGQLNATPGGEQGSASSGLAVTGAWVGGLVLIALLCLVGGALALRNQRRLQG